MTETATASAVTLMDNSSFFVTATDMETAAVVQDKTHLLNGSDTFMKFRSQRRILASTT